MSYESNTHAAGAHSNSHFKIKWNPCKFRTEICNDWISKGVCSLGDRCIFAHGSEMLRSVEAPAPCRYGRNCRFSGDRCDFDHRCDISRVSCPFGYGCNISSCGYSHEDVYEPRSPKPTVKAIKAPDAPKKSKVSSIPKRPNWADDDEELESVSTDPRMKKITLIIPLEDDEESDTEEEKVEEKIESSIDMEIDSDSNHVDSDSNIRVSPPSSPRIEPMAIPVPVVPRVPLVQSRIPIKPVSVPVSVSVPVPSAAPPHLNERIHNLTLTDIYQKHLLTMIQSSIDRTRQTIDYVGNFSRRDVSKLLSITVDEPLPPVFQYDSFPPTQEKVVKRLEEIIKYESELIKSRQSLLDILSRSLYDFVSAHRM